MQITPGLAHPLDRQFAFGRYRDLELAGQAVLYLEKHGLDQEAVIRCLIDEFELDRETAQAIAALAA